MGISRLLEVVREWLFPCHISEIKVKGRARARVGVDVSCFLMKGVKRNSKKSSDPWNYVLNLARFLRSNGLDPVLVLEGERYGPKGVAYLKRNSAPPVDVRDDTQKNSFIKECETEGIMYTTSVYEADAQIAKLFKDGLIDLVLTEDSDLIVYGCPYILYKLDINSGNAMFFDQFILEFVLDASYNEDKFRRICLIVGSDYTSGVFGFGICAAKKLYKLMDPKDSFQEIMFKIWEHFVKLEVHAEFGEEMEKGEIAFNHHPVFDVLTGKIVPLLQYSSPEEGKKAKLVTGTGIEAKFLSNISNLSIRKEVPQLDFLLTVFKCPRCSTSFETRADFLNHYQSHRVCEDCGRKFDFPYQVDIHRFCHTDERPHACPDCEKCYAIVSRLNTHRRTHEPTPRFVCSYCRMGFSRISGLKEHEVIHTGKQAFPCDKCNKRFATRPRLRRHQLTHTGEKKFVCNFCQKNLKCNLKKHLNIHTGLKNYRRRTCGMNFSDPSSRRNHETTHSNARPYKCSKCGKGFKTQRNRSRHEKTVRH